MSLLERHTLIVQHLESCKGYGQDKPETRSRAGEEDEASSELAWQYAAGQ